MNFFDKEAEATYRSLGLGRAPLRLDAESNRREKAIALGGEAPEFPRILIGRSRYEAILSNLVSSQLLRASNTPPAFPEGFLAAYFRERCRSAAYDKLLHGENHHSEVRPDATSAEQRAHLYRRALMQRIVSHIERRRLNSRTWLDQVWQKIVGPRMAAESQLVRIDRGAKRAILRSLNASLAFSLRRRPDLPSQLSDALGVPICEIRVAS